MIYRRRRIASFAAEFDLLSPTSRIHHAHSMPSAKITIPPLRMGATFLNIWPVQEHPKPASWRDTQYDSGSPAFFILRDATVHTASGIVTIGQDVIEETLHLFDAPALDAKLTPTELTLPDRPAAALQGAWIHLLAAGCANHFHLLLDSLARLFAVPAYYQAIAHGVLLPPAAAALQDLCIPAALQIRPAADPETIQVETLFLPLTVYGVASYHPLVATFFAHLSARVPDDNSPTPPRLYLDRRAHPARPLLNEAVIIDALTPLGFTPIDPATLTPAAQINLFRNATAIIAPHGAALTNIGFAPPTCAILELQSDAYTHWGFRNLAALRHQPYDCVLGRASPIHPQSWQISPTHVQAAAAAL